MIFSLGAEEIVPNQYAQINLLKNPYDRCILEFVATNFYQENVRS